MRTVLPHDRHVCHDCGASSRERGPYWGNRYAVLDYGTDTIPPREPDMSQPVRCDACEVASRDVTGADRATGKA